MEPDHTSIHLELGRFADESSRDETGEIGVYGLHPNQASTIMSRTSFAAPSLVVLLTVGAGCAPPPEAKRPAPPPVEQPAPISAASLDGMPLDLSGIVIEGHGPNLARLTMSTTQLSCDLAPREDDEQRMTVTMVRELGKKDQWRVARLDAATPTFEGETRFALRNAPVVALPPSLGEKTKATAHFNVPLELDNQTIRFEVAGDLEALGCGSLTSSKATTSHDRLSLTVGGEAIPIAGATYRRDPKTRKHRVALSTSPIDCDGSHGETEIGVELTLDRVGRSVEALGLGGMRIGRDVDEAVAAGAITSQLRGLGKTVVVTVDGSAEIDGYPFTLKGETEATYCR